MCYIESEIRFFRLTISRDAWLMPKEFFEILELIEVIKNQVFFLVKLPQEKTNKLLRAHRGCLGFERRRRT